MRKKGVTEDTVRVIKSTEEIDGRRHVEYVVDG